MFLNLYKLFNQYFGEFSKDISKGSLIMMTPAKVEISVRISKIVIRSFKMKYAMKLDQIVIVKKLQFAV